MGENLLNDSPRYRSFVNERDRALERIHQNAQMDIAQYMKDFFQQTEMIASYLSLKSSGDSLANFQHLSQSFSNNVQATLAHIFPMIVGRIKRMRHAVYVLTYASEVEALGQATQIKVKQAGWDAKFPQITKDQVHAAMNAKTILGEDLDKRVWLSLMKLKNRIAQAFDLALVQELSPAEILQKVAGAFPELQVYARAPRALRVAKPREAEDVKNRTNKYFLDDEEKIDFTTTIMDDGDWNLAVDAYKDSELPASRFEPGPNWDPESGTFKYNWEIEQDLTDDFVQQVRSGQVAAANDLGIKEFVWIAIIDEKTCRVCCLPRNGRTTSEIEQMLADGKLDAEECDAIVPPAHPFCRCQIGPVASTDEVEGPDWKNFGEWLNS